MSIKHYCDACGSELGPENPNRGKGYVLEHLFEEAVESETEVDEDGDPVDEIVTKATVHAKIIFGVTTNKNQRMSFGDGDLCAECCNEALQDGNIKD